jgi:serine/threonine protein kinase
VGLSIRQNNVLIDETFTARLADFGYASVVGEVEENMSYLQTSKQRPGEWKWTAPERLFEDSEPTPRSDIYSFGNIVHQASHSLRIQFSSEPFAGLIWRAAMEK